MFYNEEDNTKLIVSDDFVEIYRNFNVCDQIMKIIKLSERELYLLLVLCIDKHDNENPIVLHNYRPFKEKIKELYELQDNKETNNQVILDLIRETNDNHIDSDCIIDSYGNKLPEPFDKSEVRDKKIDIISNI
jgi:hypothetical protein